MKVCGAASEDENDLFSEIQQIDASEVRKKVQNLPCITPSDLQRLISAHCFGAAIECERLDHCSADQALLTDPQSFLAITELLR